MPQNQIKEKIIEIERNKRIRIYRQWNGKKWIWYVEPQTLITWFFFIKSWGASNWGANSLLIRIKGYYSLEEAEKYAEGLKSNYLAT